VAPYLDLGLPVLIGSEPLIPAGLARGAVGSVSGMAAAFPDVVRDALDDPSTKNEARLQDLRAALEASGQFIPAAKHLLGIRGVPVGPGMRAPLRRLRADEQARLQTDAGVFLGAASPA
jgi:dihydrodipicolinate synthase/N-acetylneuraminate lyase